MSKDVKNVVVSVDKELWRAAKVLAAQRERSCASSLWLTGCACCWSKMKIR